MGKLIEEPTWRDRLHVFSDRANAGQKLACRLVTAYRDQELWLFAIPAGGVPVAAEIARALKIPLDLIIVRKIQLPWTTEAGFGALDPAGEAVLNDEMLRRMPLSPQDIEVQVQKTAAVLKRREERLRGGRPYPELRGRPVIIADDGLASGYTMRAAIRFLRSRGAGKVIVAVPTAAERTVWDLLPLVDELYCLNIRGGFSFAVADAYQNWYDLTEEEVLDLLKSLHPAKKT